MIFIAFAIKLIQILHTYEECIHRKTEFISPDLHIVEEGSTLAEIGSVFDPMCETSSDLGVKEFNRIAQCGKTATSLFQG